MKKQAMNRTCRSLFRLVILCVVLLPAVAPAWSFMTIQDVQTTDVTSSGFAVIWKTCDSEVPHVGVAARPRIAVFSDAGGTDDISSQLEVTTVPLFGGDPDGFDDYDRQEDMEALRALAQDLGLMKIGVQGCLPQTTYFFKIYSENGGPEASWPPSGLASVTTTAVNAFIVDSKQVLVSLTDDLGTLDARGWLATASSSDAIYPVSTYVEDGTGTNQAYLNLSNLFDVDEDNWTPMGLKVITIEVRPPDTDPLRRGSVLFFTEAFVVSQVHKININVDEEGDNTPPGVEATPVGGSYPAALSVTLETNEPAYVFYTIDEQEPTVSSNLYIDPIPIEADTTIKFMAVDMAGNQSAVRTEVYTVVYNQMPYTPSSPSPADGATGISIDPTLRWQGGDPDPGDAVAYDVYFGTTESGMVKICQGLTEGACQPSEFVNHFDTQYFWQVLAKDDKGDEVAGPVWRFTTFTSTGDEDRDGLTNEEEMFHGTDPFHWDTDGDGYGDGDEIAWGSDPQDKNSIPNIWCEGDFDGDGDVDGADLAVFGDAFDARSVDANYNSAADFDQNGHVEISDLDIFVNDFGRIDCPEMFSPGDLDRDGDIDEQDHALFIATLGLCQNDPGFDGAADYDGDGCVTNADYAIWYGYYQTVQPCVSGDIDQDGDVDVDDETAFLEAVGSCLGDPDFLPQADCDGDGCITNADYAAWYSSFHS